MIELSMRPRRIFANSLLNRERQRACLNWSTRMRMLLITIEGEGGRNGRRRRRRRRRRRIEWNRRPLQSFTSLHATSLYSRRQINPKFSSSSMETLTRTNEVISPKCCCALLSTRNEKSPPEKTTFMSSSHFVH